MSIITNTKDQFEEWDDASHRTCFFQLQQLTREFKALGANAYGVYGQLGTLNSGKFSWHITPFFPEDSPRPKQFQFLWQLLSPSKSEGTPISFDAVSEQVFLPAIKGEDPFCNPERVATQRIVEGKLVDLLLNYAPVNLYWEEGYLDFLIIPKAHRVMCEEMQVEEYVEAMLLAKTVFERFRSAGLVNCGALYHKSGKSAGQSVFHWHAHLMMMKETPSSGWDKFSIILSTMLRQKLPQETMKNYTRYYREIIENKETHSPIKNHSHSWGTISLSLVVVCCSLFLLKKFYTIDRGR